MLNKTKLTDPKLFKYNILLFICINLYTFNYIINCCMEHMHINPSIQYLSLYKWQELWKSEQITSKMNTIFIWNRLYLQAGAVGGRQWQT